MYDIQLGNVYIAPLWTSTCTDTPSCADDNCAVGVTGCPNGLFRYGVGSAGGNMVDAQRALAITHIVGFIAVILAIVGATAKRQHISSMTALAFASGVLTTHVLVLIYHNDLMSCAGAGVKQGRGWAWIIVTLVFAGVFWVSILMWILTSPGKSSTIECADAPRQRVRLPDKRAEVAERKSSRAVCTLLHPSNDRLVSCRLDFRFASHCARTLSFFELRL